MTTDEAYIACMNDTWLVWTSGIWGDILLVRIQRDYHQPEKDLYWRVSQGKSPAFSSARPEDLRIAGANDLLEL